MQTRMFLTRKSMLVIAVAAGCSGGGGGGGPVGPPSGNMEGTYAVTHTLVVAGLGTVVCQGVAVLTQTGTSFSGTISITSEQECDDFVSQGTMSGTVTTSGTLTFTVSLPIVEGIIAGCQVLSGGPTFSGTASASSFTATRTNRIRCDLEPPLEVDIAYTIVGQKS
jgi:hypothetical protein